MGEQLSPCHTCDLHSGGFQDCECLVLKSEFHTQRCTCGVSVHCCFYREKK